MIYIEIINKYLLKRMPNFVSRNKCSSNKYIYNIALT